ncbi:MAG TPA: hypothetical protein VLX30_08515 [Burkholderiales bacterium]|nr:hypothetical protein [Burkholderiales bacterium]
MAALMLLLAGCAALAPGADERAQLGEIVARAVAAARASAAEQQRALRLAHEAYRSERSVFNRVRLATLLAALPAPLRDDSAAYALLRPLAAERGESPLQAFATLLAGQVAERLQLARESEQAAREHERSMRAAELREQALREQQQTLREQLDALKSIERGIVEREEKLRRNRR